MGHGHVWFKITHELESGEGQVRNRVLFLSPPLNLGPPVSTMTQCPWPALLASSSALAPTDCTLQVSEGDRFLLDFLSMEWSLLGLAWGQLLSARVGSGVVLGFSSLESRAASSRRWREERLLLPSRSCALERRLAAMRAMLLVPRAISLSTWVLGAGLPASPAGHRVPSSSPAGGYSLDSRLFMFRELGFCRKATPAEWSETLDGTVVPECHYCPRADLETMTPGR